MTIYVSRTTASATINRRLAAGRIVRVRSGIYSDDVGMPLEDIVKKDWQAILGKALPNAVITYRSAFTLTPTTLDDGSTYLWVSHPRTADLELPGLTIIPDASPEGPAEGDAPLGNGYYAASRERALLDNMKASRPRRGRPARTLDREEMHDQIAHIASSLSDEHRRRLLDKVDERAAVTGQVNAAESIRVFFESAAGDRPTVPTTSDAFRAAQVGRPIDARRVQMFETFAQAANGRAPHSRTSTRTAQRLRFEPFYEAYFSNYIEGTEWTVNEAAEIVLRGHIPSARPKDAHDVLGTHRVVSDFEEMSAPIGTADDFIKALKRRHAILMEGRPEVGPGEYKLTPNRAGGTHFVHPDMVDGTLREGWELLSGVYDPFARAAYTMFLVAEVHPFADGNGRVARVMMNAELDAGDQSRIIVPTVFRNEYLAALSAMSNNDNAKPLLVALDFAQRYTHQVDFSDLTGAERILEQTNAFRDSTVAEREGLSLLMPNDVERGYA